MNLTYSGNIWYFLSNLALTSGSLLVLMLKRERMLGSEESLLCWEVQLATLMGSANNNYASLKNAPMTPKDILLWAGMRKF